MAKQIFHLLDGVRLTVGVAQGLLTYKDANTALQLNVEKGMAMVGTLDNDASITNKAAYGMNQPGKLIEYAGGNLALASNKTHLIWLKTDGTLAATDMPASMDPNDASPELGPDPFKGVMLALDQQKGGLRRREAASCLLAEVKTTAGTGTVTLTGAFADTETVTVTIGGTAVVTTLDATTAASVTAAAAAVAAAINANATAAAKVLATSAAGVVTLTSKDSTLHTLTAADAAVNGTATASGAALTAQIDKVDNTIRRLTLN